MATESIIDDEWISAKEVAKLLDISLVKLWKLSNKGYFTLRTEGGVPRGRGKRVRYSKREIEIYRKTFSVDKVKEFRLEQGRIAESN